MYRKFVFAIVIILTITMLSACQKENDILGTQPFVNAETEGGAGYDCYGSYPPHSPIYFSSHEEYIAFFQEKAEQMPEHISDSMKAYIQTVRNEQQTLMIPHYRGKPVALRDKEGYSTITVMDRELYYFTWTWFYTEEDHVTIKLSKLSPEDSALAGMTSCSEFISAIWPTAPNIDNYQEKENYTLIYEDDAVINGVAKSILIRQTKSGEEYISFTTDGYLVIITAPLGTITKEWLCDFSLAAFSK